MATLGTLYRKYLHGSELAAPCVVTIHAVTQETVQPHPQEPPTKKWCLWVGGLPPELPNGILFGAKGEEQLLSIFGKVDVTTLKGKILEIFPQQLNVAGNRKTAIRFRPASRPRQVSEKRGFYSTATQARRADNRRSRRQARQAIRYALRRLL